MIGDFYNVFKRPDDARQLPESVLNVLRQGIPDGYDYEYSEVHKRLIAVPKDKTRAQKLKFDIDFGDISDFPDWAKESMPESLLNYAYRAQKKIPLKSVNVVDENGKLYPFADLHKDVFAHEHVSELFLFPSAFPPGKRVIFETQSGKTKEITISRVKTEEQYYTRMENTDFPALSIKAMYPENDSTPGKFSVSAAPKKADSVFDAVIALEILKGYVDGTLKINGNLIGKVLSEAPDYDEKMVEAQIEFWNTLLKLEEILKVSFIPKAKMPQEDYRFFEELSIMFIENRDVRYKEPTSFISVNREAIEDPGFKKVALDEKKGFALSYVNGPDKGTLLGAEFSLFTASVLTGIKVDHIDMTDMEARLYLKRAIDAPWMMYKRYAIDEASVVIEQKRMQQIYMNQA